MNVLESYGKEIVALLVPFITWSLNTIFKAHARLLLANPHTFTFLVQEPLRDKDGNQVSPTQTVHTRSLMVSNAGKETATRVEWVFNWKPFALNVWPSRHYTEHTEADNRYIIIFDSLAPGEHLGCEILSINAELPVLIMVRSDQSVARNIAMYPQPVLPAWRRRTNGILVFAGLGLVLYLVLVLLQLLVLRTPVWHS